MGCNHGAGWLGFACCRVRDRLGRSRRDQLIWKCSREQLFAISSNPFQQIFLAHFVRLDLLGHCLRDLKRLDLVHKLILRTCQFRQVIKSRLVHGFSTSWLARDALYYLVQFIIRHFVIHYISHLICIVRFSHDLVIVQSCLNIVRVFESFEFRAADGGVVNSQVFEFYQVFLWTVCFSVFILRARHRIGDGCQLIFCNYGFDASGSENARRRAKRTFLGLGLGAHGLLPRQVKHSDLYFRFSLIVSFWTLLTFLENKVQIVIASHLIRILDRVLAIVLLNGILSVADSTFLCFEAILVFFQKSGQRFLYCSFFYRLVALRVFIRVPIVNFDEVGVFKFDVLLWLK